jgi:hypothetical protein
VFPGELAALRFTWPALGPADDGRHDAEMTGRDQAIMIWRIALPPRLPSRREPDALTVADE